MSISGNCNVSRPLACLKLTMAIVITLLCFFGTNTLAFYAGAVRDVPNFQHSPRIDGLARFALNEFNKQQNAQLSFSKVVRAREQMVSGMVYYLTMEALDGHRTTGLYLAKVWVVPWTNFTQLEDFKQLDADKDGYQTSLWHAVRVQDPMVKEAAENAVKILQQRSNSLMPYELQEIVSAKGKVVNALNIFDLLLKIKWENKVQNYEVEMKRTLEGKWTMN
uniref:Cysteine proteinase inhibitor n=1 Tax=Picea sitchensis TaxID=3332 RepID=A9NU75_PICSI|nr:unknown [Picea sitchensis]